MNIFSLFTKKPISTEVPNNVINFPVRAENEIDNDEEHFRVGTSSNGLTTLTIIDPKTGNSMTLSMNEAACEKLIAMLEATL
jgi:hypothetical protein